MITCSAFHLGKMSMRLRNIQDKIITFTSDTICQIMSDTIITLCQIILITVSLYCVFLFFPAVPLSAGTKCAGWLGNTNSQTLPACPVVVGGGRLFYGSE